MHKCLNSEPSKEVNPKSATWNQNEFLAVVCHEIRNSAQSILGWAELLHDQQNPSELLSQGIEVIRRKSRLQTRLLKQVLDYSRMQSGEIWLETDIVVLLPVLEAAIKSLRPEVTAKGIHLQVELEPTAASVTGDAAQLEGVFTNLLSNAIKFTPAGGRIEVRFTCRNGIAQITVSDTGRGINSEFLPYVFDRFRQEKPNPANQEGVGLGLAIARYVVERHQGTIYAISLGEGQGATFHIFFPLDSTQVVTSSPSDTWTILVPDLKTVKTTSY
jgi:two-component system, chemotaxis family, CheB/CheR fusion protein